MSKMIRISVIALSIALATAVAGQTALASTLNLLEVGWSKPNGNQVTVLIKAAKGVSPQAVADVRTAVNDWNTAVNGIAGAPQMLIVTGVKTANIVIHMKIGGGAVLGQALPKTISPFSCQLSSVSIQLSGKAFGQNFSSAGTRNVARHELGHALGLGHGDDPSDLMYATAESSEIFGDDDVMPSQCDKKGIDAVYPVPADCDIPSSVTCP